MDDWRERLTYFLLGCCAAAVVWLAAGGMSSDQRVAAERARWIRVCDGAGPPGLYVKQQFAKDRMQEDAEERLGLEGFFGR